LKVLVLGYLVGLHKSIGTCGDHRFVLGYYDHPSLTSGSAFDLNHDRCGEHPSFDTMAPEGQAANLDWAAAASSEVPMFAQMQPVLKEQAQRALFDEQAAKEVLPR
jgi:hypothetical protein